MKKDPIVFIEHILECIELIEEYTRGVTKEEFFKSKQLQDSVQEIQNFKTKLLEIKRDLSHL